MSDLLSSSEASLPVFRRRQLLGIGASGLSALALGSLLAGERARAAESAAADVPRNPFQGILDKPHHTARAKRIIYLFMATWFRGRQAVQKELLAGSLPLGMFLAEIERKPPVRVPGTAVFMTGNAEGTPGALLHNLKHNKVLHERVILLRFAVGDAPHVDPADRLQIEQLSLGFYRVTGFFGFMESPNIEHVLERCAAEGLELDPMKTTYFLGRETILATRRTGMARWRKQLFSFMARNAQQATAYFQLPPNRVVELGMQVEI